MFLLCLCDEVPPFVCISVCCVECFISAAELLFVFYHTQIQSLIAAVAYTQCLTAEKCHVNQATAPTSCCKNYLAVWCIAKTSYSFLHAVLLVTVHRTAHVAVAGQ